MDSIWIWAMLYSRNVSTAYIVSESKAEIILGLDIMVANEQNLFHIINFNVGMSKY